MNSYAINGVEIRAPISYKPQFATTSTEDSDRTQDLVMHNKPMGTVVRYDMQWGSLNTEEVRAILSGCLNKESFEFTHYDVLSGWVTRPFYASNYSVEAVYITERNGQPEERWQGLTINFVAINPI